MIFKLIGKSLIQYIYEIRKLVLNHDSNELSEVSLTCPKWEISRRPSSWDLSCDAGYSFSKKATKGYLWGLEALQDH